MVYLDLAEAFSKSKALSLPPHRPYDGAIDFLPGATLPKSRMYSLARHKCEAIEHYILDALSAGLIRPCTSPMRAGFFFVERKDETLHPCIDYRDLNSITVRNKYPLPLMNAAFESLEARVFTKLDLHNAYHLVWIQEEDEWKTGFNSPLGHFE